MAAIGELPDRLPTLQQPAGARAPASTAAAAPGGPLGLRTGQGADGDRSAGRTPPANAFETLIVSPDGGVLVSGWIDDRFDPIRRLQVAAEGWRLNFEGENLARVRRPDAVSGPEGPHALGYFGLAFGDCRLGASQTAEIEIGLESGAVISAATGVRVASSGELRDAALTYLTLSRFPGSMQAKAAACLDRGLGDQIVAINRSVVGRLQNGPYIERFGPERAEIKGSLVICLYGRPEYVFLQCALFSAKPGIDDYELIYVVNSPELSEHILAEARLAAMIYDLPITVVVLAGNAGFAGANNVAARTARSGRLIFVNPDVFPRDEDWALKHTGILLSRPADETTLFGALLYYDDGSLMHAGMYIDMDQGATISATGTSAWRLLRVEHHGKGAPPDDPAFTRPRPVTAVTGAFISIDRNWFERLGGFSIDYVLGHYEDADLCLRSIEAGVAPWVHDLRLLHLEGKGSNRQPVHEGGSLVNRWLFTTRWSDTVRNGLLGRAPSRPLIHGVA